MAKRKRDRVAPDGPQRREDPPLRQQGLGESGQAKRLAPSSGLSSRAVTLSLLAILAVGLLVRLLHFAAIAGTAFPEIPPIAAGSDMHSYWQWAHRILSGDLLGRDTYHPSTDWIKTIAAQEHWDRWLTGKQIFHWAPLYPYWVAALLFLFDGSLRAILLVQLLAASLHPLPLFFLARRLFDDWAGLAAAAITAVYGPLIFHQGVLLRDWLPPILEPLFLLAVLRAQDGRRGSDWLLAGGCLGLAVLTKETALLLLPLAGLWILWKSWPEWQQVIRSGAWLLVGTSLVLSPLIFRNAVVGAPLFAVSDRAAQSFIEGNALNSPAYGLVLDLDSWKRIIQHADGTLPSVIQETLKTYRGDFGAFFRKQLLRLRALADPYEVPNNESFYYGEDISPALRMTLRYGFVFPLGVAGLLLSGPAWRRRLLLYLYLLVTLAGLTFSTILGRYRLVLVAILIMFAGGFLRWMAEAAQQRKIGRMLGGLALVAGTAMIQQTWLPFVEPKAYGRPQEYVLAAQIYGSQGRPERAVSELERLRERLAEHPRMADFRPDISRLEGDFRLLWARRLLLGGKRAEAKGQVELAQTAYSERVDTALGDRYHELGQLYLALHEPGKARAVFELFLAIEGTGSRADQVRQLLSRLDGLRR